MAHPSDEELVARLIEGESSVASAAGRHLTAGCSRCEERMRQLRAVLDSLRAGALEDAPAHCTARALAWLREQGAAVSASYAAAKSPLAPPRRAAGTIASVGNRVRRAVEEMRATVALDSAASALFAGVRGGTAASERQLLLESPAGQIVLRVVPGARGRVEVQGQFLCESASFDVGRARAVLNAAGKETVRRLTAHGQFRFTGVVPGTIQVRIEGESLRVIGDPIEIAAG